MSYNIFNAILDFFNGDLEFVTKTKAKERQAICNQCEAKNKKLNVCTICGCYLPAKTKLKESSCPMSQW